MIETLTVRSPRTTYCAFLDIRKAYDVAWRDAALLRLLRGGVTRLAWCLIADLCDGTVSRVRVHGRCSEDWGDDNGVRQGSVLSPLLFNLLINSLAAAIRRVCPGVRLGTSADAPRVTVLMYADDIVILAESPEDLQRALDAATAWARSWRFQFGIGPEKSAVMVVHPTRARVPVFRLADALLPLVTSYRYLGVIIHSQLRWNDHVCHIAQRGDRRLHQSRPP